MTGGPGDAGKGAWERGSVGAWEQHQKVIGHGDTHRRTSLAQGRRRRGDTGKEQCGSMGVRGYGGRAERQGLAACRTIPTRCDEFFEMLFLGMFSGKNGH